MTANPRDPTLETEAPVSTETVVSPSPAWVGTQAWANSVREHVVRLLANVGADATSLRALAELVHEHRAWTVLSRPDGTFFASWEEFCEHHETWGFGYPWKLICEAAKVGGARPDNPARSPKHRRGEPPWTDPGTGSEHAPVGSRLWAELVRLRMQSLVHNLSSRHSVAESLARYRAIIHEHQAWTLMDTEDGSAFESWDDLCAHPQPWGFGRPWVEICEAAEGGLGRPFSTKEARAGSCDPTRATTDNTAAAEHRTVADGQEAPKANGAKAKGAKANGKQPPIRLVPPPGADDPFDGAPDDDPRPVVHVGPDLYVLASEVLCTWSPLEDNAYVRAGALCTVVNAGGPLEQKQMLEPETPRVLPLTVPGLSQRLHRVMRFLKRTKKGDHSCSCPPRVVTELNARGEWPGIRQLIGITETPFLRSDGSVCQEPGYDAETGYLYVPRGVEYPRVPEHPTHEQANAALRELQEPFSDFPFVSPAAALAPIAAVLTMLARPAIKGSIPCFAFDASTKRTGKSRLTDAIAIISTGRNASRKTFPDDDIELEKVLSSYARAGARLIVLDNVTRRFGGGPLDCILTAIDFVDLRVLGQTEIATVLWTAMLMCSGNNLDFGEDTISRTILCRMESLLENPEDRTNFRHEQLLDYLRENRVQLVVAALTILRAWACARGRFTESSWVKAEFKWGGFEPWAELIAPALVFAGGPNILSARPPKSRVAGDTMGALAIIHEYLPTLAPPTKNDPAPQLSTKITARDIVGSIFPAPKRGDRPDGFERLRDALEQLGATSKAGEPPTQAVVGKILNRSNGRVLGTRRLCSMDNGRGTRVYWIEAVEAGDP